MFLNGIKSLQILKSKVISETTFVYHNRHLYDDAISLNTPIVALSIHSGAFESLHRSLVHPERRVRVLTADFKSSSLTHWLKDLRSFPNISPLDLQQLVTYIKSPQFDNETLAIMVDQGRGTPDSSFALGSYSFPLYLKIPRILHHKSQILLFRTWTEHQKVHISFEKLIPKELSFDQTQDLIIHEIQNWIKQYPEQAIWHYKQRTYKPSI
jgi:KDO2-lipid IV(A) lauroyltransferase